MEFPTVKALKILAAAMFALFIADGATAGSDSGHGDASHEVTVATGDSHDIEASHGQDDASGRHWGYSGTGGPDFWGEMSREYAACKQGWMQSPIDFSSDAGTDAVLEPLAFDYSLTPLYSVHNGHTIQVNYAPGSGVTIDAKRFELLQFHFHSPSEHTIDGGHAAMEMHLVHKSADGAFAVVGVMMTAGDENIGLREIWSSMPVTGGREHVDDMVLVNVRDLLPGDVRYHRYMGSLTTPPCTEGINWYVLKQPVQVSVDQVQQFLAAVGPNARPTQAYNHRLVLSPSAAN